MPQYDEIEIEDMTYDPKTLTFSYPCPCGDRFKVSLEDLWDGEDIADCNSCTLYIQVIYEKENLPPLPDNDDSDDENENNKESLKEDGSDENDKAEEEKKEDGNRPTTSREKEVTLGMGNMTLSCSLQEEQNNNKSAVAA
jgi:diphthamide biosynthesis protein 3